MTQAPVDYQAKAERHNRNTAKRFPLFAAAGVLEEVVEPWTAESAEQRFNDFLDDVREVRRAGYRKAFATRAEMARMMTPEQVRELDRRFARTYPHKPEYLADFWWTQGKRLEEIG